MGSLPEDLMDSFYDIRPIVFPQTTFFVADRQTIKTNFYGRLSPIATFRIVRVTFTLCTWLDPSVMWPMINRGVVRLRIIDTDYGEFPLVETLAGYPQTKRRKPVDNLGMRLEIPLTIHGAEYFFAIVTWTPEPRRIKNLIGKMTLSGIKRRSTV